MMSYPKHHCSQFPALTGIPYSSIAFSSNYNKTQSCFYVFLGPGGMGPHLLTHSPLHSQGRILLAPWIPQHHGFSSTQFQQPSSLLPQVLCTAVSSALNNSPGHFSTGWFLSLLAPSHPSDGPFLTTLVFFKLSWYLLSQISVHNIYSMFPSKCDEVLLSLFFPLDCQLHEGRPFLFPSPVCPLSVCLSFGECLLTD